MKPLTLVLAVAALGAVLAGCSPGKSGDAAAGDKLVVGFAQVGSESGWRTANTESVKAAAEESGVDLKFADAQGKQENQIKAIRSFIAQKVDVIVFPPVVASGWEPVLAEAKKAGIPVIFSDRKAEVSGDLYAAFIGSDFVDEGRKAAEWMAKKMNGRATIAELTGTVGADPATDRKRGFAEVLAKHPGMKIVVSQTGDFNRAKGKEVMEAILKGPFGAQIDAVYAHNDDMALGAIQAIEEAGKKPGSDVIVVSIDGIRDAFVAMSEGKLNCTVECNPLLGPLIMDAAARLKKGETLERWIKPEEGVFDQESAERELPNRKY